MNAAWAMASCAGAVVALLGAEHRASQRGKWLAKSWASCSFIVVALSSGAAHLTYGRWILLGLALCQVGDVLLIPVTRPTVFRLGIGAFVLGHGAFLCGFVTRPLDVRWLATAALVLGLTLAA